MSYTLDGVVLVLVAALVAATRLLARVVARL